MTSGGSVASDLVIEFRDKIQAVINEYSVKFAESHTSKPDVQINTSKIVWRIGKYNENRIAGPLDKTRAWAFNTDRNGTILEEAAILAAHLIEHGKYNDGRFNNSLDNEGKFLRRDPIKEAPA